MKLLFLDTETSPALVYTYRFRDAYISPDQVKHYSFFLCYQYAWNDGPVKVSSLRHIKHTLTDKDDKQLAKDLADLVSQADIVIAHNAERFDLGFLRARLAVHKLPPFNPPQVIDTLKESRRAFKIESHALGAIGKNFGIGEKFHSGGFQTSIACMAGDQKAWGKLLKYGKQDVVLLRDIYYATRPFMKSHPDLSPQDPFPHCPKCNGTHLEGRGFAANQRQSFKRYQCHDCKSFIQIPIRGSKSMMRAA